MIDGGFDTAVRLPSALQPTTLAIADSTTAGAPLRKKGRKRSTGTAGTAGPAGEPGSTLIQNDTPQTAWQLPDGKRYAEFFQGRAQSTQNWPIVADDRLCVRSPAQLAHTVELLPLTRQCAGRICDDRFRTIVYAVPPATSTALVVT